VLTAKTQDACNRALDGLARGASLIDVLGIILEIAELSRAVSGASILIGEASGPIRIGPRSRDVDVPEGLFDAIETPSSTSTVDDVAKDPRWTGIAGDLVEAGVRSLWIEPIRGFGADTIGCVVILRNQTGGPTDEELALGTSCARLAGLAIDRKRRDEELGDREAEISAVLEAVIDGIITIDHRGVVETLNEAAERMFGYRSDEVVGRNVSMLMGPDDARSHDSYLARYLSTGERRVIGIGREVEGRRKDGTMFPLELGVSEFRFGGARKFTGILRDLTARKRLEAQVRRSQKLEAIGTLAAGVAHDFNNLLMGIMGCTTIAISKLPDGSPARLFLDEAKAAAERGTRLTRQLLAFSRRTPSEFRPMSLNDVVKGTDLMLRRLISEDIELATDLAPSAPIRGDLAQIEQILLNLVVNARDALTGPGVIRIRTVVERVDRRGSGAAEPFVVLSVEDSGTGMDAATQARIFEPFFTTKGPDRGTGLGLSTVYGIAEQHGAFIEVDSAVGRGTTMRIFFPYAGDGGPLEASTSDPSPEGRERILLVEDDRLVRLTIAHTLRTAGYDVVEAASGLEGIELFDSKGPPDLLLSDLVMPDMNGLELFSKLRALHGNVPVLFMSGYADADKLTRITDEGVAFIEKPFTDEALARKVREVLEAPR
jgi:PAS domain S-box-containing protein